MSQNSNSVPPNNSKDQLPKDNQDLNRPQQTKNWGNTHNISTNQIDRHNGAESQTNISNCPTFQISFSSSKKAVEQNDQRNQRVSHKTKINIQKIVNQIINNSQPLQLKDIGFSAVNKLMQEQFKNMSQEQIFQSNFQFQQLYNDIYSSVQDKIKHRSTQFETNIEKFQANSRFYNTMRETYTDNISQINSSSLQIVQLEYQLKKALYNNKKQLLIKQSLQQKLKQLENEEQQIEDNIFMQDLSQMDASMQSMGLEYDYSGIAVDEYIDPSAIRGLNVAMNMSENQFQRMFVCPRRSSEKD